MIIIPRTAPDSSIENHLRATLPDPNAFDGYEWRVEYVKNPEPTFEPIISAIIHVAQFLKVRYKYGSGMIWKWEYKGEIN